MEYVKWERFGGYVQKVQMFNFRVFSSQGFYLFLLFFFVGLFKVIVLVIFCYCYKNFRRNRLIVMLFFGFFKGISKQQIGRGGVQVDRKRIFNNEEFVKLVSFFWEELRFLWLEVYKQWLGCCLVGSFIIFEFIFCCDQEEGDIEDECGERI